jgi:O-antigen biosynthesis protein WbqP
MYAICPSNSGLAQINKIDIYTPKLFAETDAKMINHRNVLNYFKYIFLNLIGKGFGDRMSE